MPWASESCMNASIYPQVICVEHRCDSHSDFSGWGCEDLLADHQSGILLKSFRGSESYPLSGQVDSYIFDSRYPMLCEQLLAISSRICTWCAARPWSLKFHKTMLLLVLMYEKLHKFWWNFEQFIQKYKVCLLIKQGSVLFITTQAMSAPVFVKCSSWYSSCRCM